MKTIGDEIANGIKRIESEIDRDVGKEILYGVRCDVVDGILNEPWKMVQIEVCYEIMREVWNGILNEND